MNDDNKPPDMNPNTVIIIIIAIFVLAFIANMASPPSQVKMYDPERAAAVNRAVEAAQIRSGFTLTDEEVNEITEKKFMEEVRKNKE